MAAELKISPRLEELGAICNAGYAIGLHIRFSTPTFFFQTYRREWLEYYSQNGLVLHDPIVRWGFGTTGVIRWDALAGEDEQGVLQQAAEHGLRYGIAVALLEHGSRTIAGFAHTDRNFTDSEVGAIRRILSELHEDTVKQEQLPLEERAALKQLSILLSQG